MIRESQLWSGVARKDYLCNLCTGTIRRGETYTRTRVYWSAVVGPQGQTAGIATGRYHAACRERHESAQYEQRRATAALAANLSNGHG